MTGVMLSMFQMDVDDVDLYIPPSGCVIGSDDPATDFDPSIPTHDTPLLLCHLTPVHIYAHVLVYGL